MKILKFIHKAITILMVALFFISISCMDSENLWIPATGLIGSGLYLVIHGIYTGALFGSIEESQE